MFIGGVRQIDDLDEGETAAPEPDMGYELRAIGGSRFDAAKVASFIRRCDAIVARLSLGGVVFGFQLPSSRV